MSLYVASGKYNCTGLDGQKIRGLGFQPKVVIVGLNGISSPILRTDAMAGDLSVLFGGATGAANLIQALESDGFELGTNVAVNRAMGFPPVLYQFVYTALGGTDVVTGSYTGDALDNHAITGLGFQPGLVLIRSAYSGETAALKTSAMAGATSFKDAGASASVTDAIESLDADGFTLGTNGAVNTSGRVYYYVAINSAAGGFEAGSYTGDGSDDRAIAVSFDPEFVVVRQDGTIRPMMATVLGDYWGAGRTLDLANGGEFTNVIDSLGANQFTVSYTSSSPWVNENTKTHYWFALHSDALTRDKRFVSAAEVEVAIEPSAPAVRLSHLPVEVVLAETNALLEVYQLGVEVIVTRLRGGGRAQFRGFSRGVGRGYR